jgi:hypothetical protein
MKTTSATHRTGSIHHSGARFGDCLAGTCPDAIAGAAGALAEGAAIFGKQV